MVTGKAIVAVMMACGVGPAFATFREWVPSDYVPGAVAFWDAIDNAGGGSHDPSAATWKNLGTGGSTYDLTIKDAVWCDGNSLSNGINTLAAYGSTTISYTTSEFAIDNYNVGGEDSSARWIFSNGINTYFVLEGGQFEFMNGTLSSAFSYKKTGFHTFAWEATNLTHYLDGVSQSTGSGASWGAAGGNGYANRIFLGVNTANMLRGFHGKYYSIRLYDRVLTAEEIAWNDALDKARFAGAAITATPPASAIPDVVVASTLAGVGGVEPCGCYAVDPSAGHVFTTPQLANAADVWHVCTGYTLERWNADAAAWGTAVMHGDEYAVAVAAGDKVRITWQWAPASGTFASGYVTNGLVAFWDAIDNVGTGIHDPSAVTWKNLGYGGSTYDLTVKDAVWRDGNSLSNGIDTLAAYGSTPIFYATSEFALENINTGGEDSNARWIFCNGDPTYGVGTYCVLSSSTVAFQNGKESGALSYKSQGFHVVAWESTNKTHYVDGAAVSDWSGSSWGTGGGNGYANRIFLGVNTANMQRGFHGKYYAIRLYDRVLSAAEIEHNTRVDKARFAGGSVAPETGAVFVASQVAGLGGREPNGFYAPDAWTFSVGATTQTVRGVEYECSGYALETWDATTSTWGTPVAYAGTTFTSPDGTDFASLRLTWLWTPVRGLRTAADYTAADYIPSGLVAQWDAVDNAGAGAHDPSAATWKNLGYGGSIYDLTVKDAIWCDGNSLSNGIGTLAAYGTRPISYQSAEFAIENYVEADSEATSRWVFSNGINAFCILEADKFEFQEYEASSAFCYKKDGFHTLAWKKQGSVHYLDGVAGTTISSGGWDAHGGNGYDNRIFLGLNTVNMKRGFHGKYHSIRLYDRALSAAEVAYNRAVDVARFGDGLAVTNVVVAASEWNGSLAADAYEVLGSWTFTASADPGGSLPNMVCVQTLQGDGTWSGKQFVDGVSYAYEAGTSPATVRIEFVKSKMTVIIIR